MPITREILLELGRRTISLRENGKVIGSWPVAIGDPRTPTPRAASRWRTRWSTLSTRAPRAARSTLSVGANGPLGDRWLGFKEQWR